MKKLLIGGVVIAAAIAVPTIAQNAARPDRNAPVTRSDVENRVKTMFERVDANRDGFVTKDEAQAVREARRGKFRDAAFARLDADKDGSISRAEFDAPRAGRGERAEHRGRHGMHRGMAMRGIGGGKMFDRADANKDGRVSLAEATALPMQMFDRADANHDGTVTPDERKAAREQFRAQWKQRREG